MTIMTGSKTAKTCSRTTKPNGKTMTGTASATIVIPMTMVTEETTYSTYSQLTPKNGQTSTVTELGTIRTRMTTTTTSAMAKRE